MDGRKMKIVFSSGINDLSECNSSFDRGVLRVAYTGKNRNNSFISKETFERCISSIYNCPIVCRYDREENSIGAHDMELIKDNDGDIRIVNITQPVGVVPESGKFWWEEIEDTSGVHEYLCVDVLLWKRQEAYWKIKENGITDESMEIIVHEGEMVDGVFVISRFEFTAFCLLGTAEPCFESASLEVFSCDGFKQQFAEMMQEFKETFSLAQLSTETSVYKKNMEGGEIALDKKRKLMAKYGLTEESLDFSLEDFTLEELQIKFEEIKTKSKADEDDNGEDPKPETPDDNGGTQNNEGEQGDNGTFALEGQFRDELYGALESEKVETCWGMDSHYWLWDYDRETAEVYATDALDWNLYGFSYSMDGDHVVVDFASKKRMKLAVEPFDEGSQTSPMSGMFSKIVERYSANDKQWAEKFQKASETISAMQGELDILRQFKADAEGAAELEKRNDIFEQFEDLVGVEAFETLRKKCMEYSTDVLEEKCYAIRGRNGSAAKFSLGQRPPKLVVERGNPASEPYGGVFAEYGFVADNQHN